MGVSDIEFLGSGDGDEDAEPGESGPDAGSDAASGTGIGSACRWYRQKPSGPVAALSAALLVVVTAAAFAVVTQQRQSDDFDVTLISAQYTMRQDASGIDLALALQNAGPTMIELTGVAVYQPGLIRSTQTGDAAGVTESEAGATTASALGPGTAITSLALTPKDVEIVTVPFRYDCAVSSFPAVSRSVGLAGFSARGTAHTARLTLPAYVTPWQPGGVLRSALCNQPTPESDLNVRYAGIGSTLMQLTPVRFDYTISLTAPTATPVTVSSISQDNPGIAASVDPALPIEVLDGQTVLVTITWRVMSCVIATSDRSAVGVKITASAEQSVQTWDARLGAQFTRDLDAEITTVCSGG
ncbi:MAG TPA: hypothetical protein VGS97_25140 [Actinocrinis sp.]|uniref:hypothetical protein n=1 Tax=Actinocrinis sp. TaxID=1920516 RepID=UPI002DDD1386|nr:hypothetical protein [Actinocrinis sp.]HEV2347405.1 hypothetical protein [Actinocrinis sp.]